MLATDAQLLPQELDISSVYSISLRDGPGRVHKVVFINDLFCPPCDVRGRSTHARCSLYCICEWARCTLSPLRHDAWDAAGGRFAGARCSASTDAQAKD